MKSRYQPISKAEQENVGKKAELERRILGACLKRDRSILERIIASVQLEDFSEPANRTLFGLILDAAIDEDIPTTFGIGERARKTAQTHALPILHDLVLPESDYATHASIAADCRQLKDAGERHRLGMLGNFIANSAASLNGQTTRELTAEIYNRLLTLMTGGQARASMDLSDAVAIAEARQLEYRKLNYYQRLNTGFPRLDAKLVLSPGELTVLGGYTSHGKSSLALCIANHLIASGISVLYISLEMDAATIVYRLAALNGETELMTFVRGNITGLENNLGLKRIAPYMHRLHIRDLDQASEAEIVLMMQQHMLQHPETGLIVIDYLQNVDCERVKVPSRHLQVSSIARYFRSAAKRLKVHTMLLSQLARPEKRDGKPRLANKYDLKESGDLENTADVILLVNRLEEGPDWYGLIDLAKQRNGVRGYFGMRFTGAHVRFEQGSIPYPILNRYKLETHNVE